MKLRLKLKTMKNLEITADWILNNFSHTGYYPGDGTASIFCDSSDLKWNKLALKGIPYDYSEVFENEIGEFQAEFHFELNDIAEIAPEFYKKGMEYNNINKEYKVKRR